MLSYIFWVIFFFVIWKLITSVLLPYRSYLQYREMLKKSPYKLLDRGFVPYASKNFIKWIQDRKKYRDSYYETKKIYPKYDVALSNISNKVLLEFINQDLVKDFYAHEGTKTYIKQEEFRKNAKRMLGSSVVFDQGEIWKRKRKVMTTLLNFNYLKSKQYIFQKNIKEKFKEFPKNSEFKKSLQEIIVSITSTNLIEMFFGGSDFQAENLRIDGKKLEMYMLELFGDIGNQMFDPLGFLFGQDFLRLGLRANDRRVNEKLSKFHGQIRKLTQRRLNEIKQKNQTKSEQEQDYIERRYHSVNGELSPQFIQELSEDFIVMYFAGTDSTGNLALMMTYFCIMNPEVLDKLLVEIQENIIDGELDHEAIKKMTYLDAIFYESVRLHTPFNAILPRQAKQDHFIGSIPIKKGTSVMTCPMANHYSKNNYDQPFKFMPERWIKDDGEMRYPKPYTWLTFSAGPRVCIGRQLAEMETKMVVVSLFMKYELKMETQNLQMSLEKMIYQPQTQLVSFKQRT